MDVLTQKDLEELIDKQAEWCVSLYLPTHRSMPEAKQDPIRFKNLLREAERVLAARGVRSSDVDELLKPAASLLDNPTFWRFQADGLAIFLSPGEFRDYRLPVSFPEVSVVGDRFHVKPLLPLLSSDDRFFVLALSLNHVRLIEGTRYGASEIEVENLPASLKEVLGSYDFEQQLQFHTRAQQSGGERAAVFHGQGGGQDDVKPRILEYFRRIDGSLHGKIGNENAPLVLAAVNELFPLYREVNTYKNLVDEGITGNPESFSAEDLRQRAWQIVEPKFLETRREAESRYKALAGTGRTSNNLEEVLVAAHDGRIEELFVAVGVQSWGGFDQERRSVAVHDQPEPGDRDLLDVCAARTVINGGAVYAVTPNDVPGGERLAAVFRY